MAEVLSLKICWDYAIQRIGRKKWRQSAKSEKSITKGTNICVLGVPEEEKREKDQKKYSKNISNTSLHIQEVQWKIKRSASQCTSCKCEK